MNQNKTVAAIVLVGILAVGGYFVGDTTVVNPVEKVVERLGADAGPVKTEPQVFLSGYSYGDRCVATSTTANNGTLSSRELLPGTTCIDYTVNQADVTLTLAASTSGWYPQNVGQVRTLWIRNASTTATADIILAAGTGINLKRATTSGSQISGDTDGENHAKIDFKRQADGDLTAIVQIFQD